VIINMVDMSAATALIYQWVLNPLMWLGLILFALCGIVVIFYIKKRRKLVFPAAEIVTLGNGKTCLNFLGNKGAGWFGRNWWGPVKLWDYGEEVMRLSDMSIVEDFSERDFQEVNGRRGVVFYRDPERKLFFPISGLDISDADRKVLASIAPSDYTRTSADILEKAKKETQSTFEKVVPYIMVGVIAIVVLISIIVTVQMVQKVTAESKAMFIDANEKCYQLAEGACNRICSVNSGVPSESAP